MTKDEAIQFGNMWLHYYEDYEYSSTYKFFQMAIKALEKEKALDEARAEIENDWQLKKYPSSPFSCGLRRAIEIVDKYKGEG